MIKFFRKIRQKLLSENKFSKYFLYAIGEIILVVIGILLALQINNYNEEAKNNLRSKSILLQLRSEFKRDSTELSNYIRLTNKKVADGKILEAALENKRFLSKDTLAFISFFNGKILLFKGFVPTFDELISSGDQNLIPNKLSNDIKRYLNTLNTLQTFSYYEKQQTKLAYNNHLHQYFDSEIMTYLWENAPSETIKLEEINAFNMNVIGFYEDPKSILHLRNVIGVDRELEWEYRGRITALISSILRTINEEIKK